MKKLLLLITILSVNLIQAQGAKTTKAPRLKLKITNAQDSQWAILYRMIGLRKQYIANRAVKNDTTSFELPKLNNRGIYLITYALPEHENAIKIYYDGEGDIEVNFDRNNVVKSLEFVSDENNLYQLYQENNKGLQSQLLKLSREKTLHNNENKFEKLKQKAADFQKQYSEFAGNSIVKYFIQADKVQIPETLVDLDSLKAFQKAHCFDVIDFNNHYLYQADYLLDKVKAYTYKDKTTRTNDIIKKDFDTVLDKIKLDSTFQYIFLRDAWKYYAGKDDYVRKDIKQKENAIIANYIGNKYLMPLTKKYEDVMLEYQIRAYSNLTIGAKAPNIVYKKGDKWTSLHSLKDADKYVLIFWSSTCSHCLKELPEVYKTLEKNKKVHVIAIGIEDADMIENWRIQKEQFANWTHVFGKGKWRNPIAKKYAILATPSYFVLDKDKKIIAKPELEKELISILNK
jgi:thiol-disulfide isomerase/thioredoxin